MSAPTTQPRAGRRWAGAWLDLLAFAGGVAVAWIAGWAATDLVWSLWLASFCVGYALIVWNLSAELREFGLAAWRDRTPGMAVGKAVTGAVQVALIVFGLAFFTVHFGR